MCGYLRRHIGPKDLKEFLRVIEMPQLELEFESDGPAQHFYPAWGAVPEKQIKGLIVMQDGRAKAVDATWWYACEEFEGTLRPNMKKQTFNARRLQLSIWQEPLKHRRGIAIATAIGEAIGPKGKEKRFFVEGARPLLMGCLYNRFNNGTYSCAVITRDAHPRFTEYHDDAFPLMLPHDPNFLKLWLSDASPDHPAIAELLQQPKIFTDLTVTAVKTYKDAVPRGEPVLVHADQWAMTS